jgi:hypothetical protein
MHFGSLLLSSFDKEEEEEEELTTAVSHDIFDVVISLHSLTTRRHIGSSEVSNKHSTPSAEYASGIH